MAIFDLAFVAACAPGPRRVVTQPQEIMVSVDVEASGPSPSTGSLIAIGACLVEDPAVGLYLEIQAMPDMPWSDEAERIHGLTRDHLAANALPPAQAMQRFDAWLTEVAGHRQPVLVGFNATFDWMFVADYFHRFLGRNPFGISGLDIKAFYMGRHRVATWAETRRERVGSALGITRRHSHYALEDAREQAELMRLIALKG